jgi:drug/metabolite transporter (DMT)-like permease
MLNLRQNRRGFIADFVLLMVAAIWGGGFVTGKLALAELSPLAILMYRFCGSALILGILFFPRLQKSGSKEKKYGLLIGLLQFIGLWVQLFGLQYTTPAKQSFLAASYVIFTPFIAWGIIKIKPLSKDIAAAIIALIGIALISLNTALNIQVGDPITLVFAAIFSWQIVLIGKYAKDLDVIVLTFYQFASAGILSLLAVGISGVNIVCSSNQVLGSMLYLVFINTTLAICLQNVAQRYTKESHAALLLSFESVFGFLFSVLIYHERITLQTVLGCGLIFAAILLAKLNKKQKSGSANCPLSS